MLACFERIDITPSKPLPLACHFAGSDSSRGVGIPLEANIVALNDNGQKLVIVSTDWFFNSITLRPKILERCGGLLAESELLVAASHTHSSPNPDQTKWRYNPVDEAYVEWVEERIAHCVLQLLLSSDWQQVVLRFATAPAEGIIHRRRKVWVATRFGLRKQMAIYPNPEGPRDHEVRILRFERPDGSLVGIVWGASCHPTDWPDPHQLSSDFPGAVRGALRRKVARELPVLFLQGFCGSLRPACIGRWRRYGNLLKRSVTAAFSVVNGPTFVRFTASGYAKWVNRMELEVLSALHVASIVEQVNPALQARRITIPLSTLGVRGDIQETSLQVIRLSQEIMIVAISAEVCWEYADLLQARFPGIHLWFVGYSDSVFGYLPTSPMIEEGGYEVTGFMAKFGIEGSFVPGIENIVLAPIAEMAKDFEVLIQ